MERSSWKFIAAAVCSSFLAAACSSGGGGAECGPGAPCGDGEYCQYDAGACGTSGSCQGMPTGCSETAGAVCSCEGLTFFSECWAAAAGQSVRAQGECP